MSHFSSINRVIELEEFKRCKQNSNAEKKTEYCMLNITYED